MRLNLLFLFAVFLLLAAQCSPQLETSAEPTGNKLKVVATTSIVGDIVKNIGGNHINLIVLLPPGTDPHAFDPTPRDLTQVADADVIFVNGLGLENFLEKMLNNAGNDVPVVAISNGIKVRTLNEDTHEDEEHHDEEQDPHAWMNPANGIVFVNNIEKELSKRDPANAAVYQSNAAAYVSELENLDYWVQEQINTIPPENRKLVTDHDTFGYYADRYGLEMAGAVLPGFSTITEPSAQELAALQDTIDQFGVRAVFVGNTVNPILAERVSEDTSIQLIPLYTGSLGETGSGADTYLNYIRYNTNAIVEALK